MASAAVNSVTWDALALGALRTAQNEKDPIDYVAATWAQFYKLIVAKGCIQTHPEAENAHQFIGINAGEAVTEFMPDEVIAGNLGSTESNPLTKMSATFVARTQNINFAQGIRGLARPAYALTRVKNDLKQLCDNIERKLLIGSTTVTSPTKNDPFLADTAWNTRQFMSLKSLFHSACDLSATGANIAGADGGTAGVWQGMIPGPGNTAASLNGVAVDGSMRAQPYFFVTADASGASILDDIDTPRARARWGGRATHLLTTWAKYQQLYTKHRDKAALPVIQGSNLGIPPVSFPYGDMEICWMRDFAVDADWDPRSAPAANHPVFGINLDAYRMFTWANPGQSIGAVDRGFDWLAYLNGVDGMETHAAATALYRRIEGMLTVMFTAPRGSNFQVLGYT